MALLSTKSIYPLDFIDGVNTVLHDAVDIPSDGRVMIIRIVARMLYSLTTSYLAYLIPGNELMEINKSFKWFFLYIQ